MRNPPLWLVDTSGRAHMTSFHLKRFSGRPTKGPWPSFFTTLSIRYTCCCEQKQRADNGSDVIFSLVATKCCHAGIRGAIPYVNQCCTLYPEPLKCKFAFEYIKVDGAGILCVQVLKCDCYTLTYRQRLRSVAVQLHHCSNHNLHHNCNDDVTMM